MIASALELYDLIVNIRTNTVTRDLYFYERQEPAHLLVTVVAQFYIHHNLTTRALEEQYRRAVRASTTIDQDVDVNSHDVGEDALLEYSQHDVTLGDNPFYSHLRHHVALIVGCVEQVERVEINHDNPAASNEYFHLGELIYAFFEGTLPELEYVGGRNGQRHAYMAEGRAFLLHVYEIAGITASSLRVGGIVAETCCIKLKSAGSIEKIADSIFHVVYSDSESELDSSKGDNSNGNTHDVGV